MENDGFLEFKWKGDQFLIFRFVRHLHLLVLQISPPLYLFFVLLLFWDGRREQTGESEAERGMTETELCALIV